MKIQYNDEVDSCWDCKLYRNGICLKDGTPSLDTSHNEGLYVVYSAAKFPCERRPCPIEVK